MDAISGPAWARSKNGSGIQRPRIAYAPDFSDAPVDPFIRSTVDETIEQARSLGMHIGTVSPFHLADPLAAVWPIISQTGVAWLKERHPDWERKVAPAIAEMAAAGQKYSARDYLGALDTIATMGRTFEHFFERYDFLVTPTTAAMPWPAKDSHPSIIDGQSVGLRGHAVFTPFANALGLPAISLPCRVGEDAMPVGIQIVAARDRDWALLAFAHDYEDRLFVHRWPPAFR
jgi:aspartyl-tRNA(Asn)/glutamyl-tRNA(Gln) amidotransferase subunit A